MLSQREQRFELFRRLLQVNDFIHISDSAYARDQILQMEKAILGKLEWYLTVPTPYVFLVRYIKASVPNDQEVLYFVVFRHTFSLCVLAVWLI